MTARCPKCGGKWDIEGLKSIHEDSHYAFLVYDGDRIGIICYYCDTEISYVIERNQLEEFHELELKIVYEELEEMEKSI